MAIIVLTSAGGSPGVTTTGLGLALSWPRPVLLADCDRHPNQAVLAGYLRGLSAGGRGLAGLVQDYRALQPASGQRLIDQTLALEDGTDHTRRFLPGFTNSGSATLFDSYWTRFVAQLEQLDRTDVIIDAGRLPEGGLPEALLERASRVLVLTRSGLPALASLRLLLPELTDSLDDDAARLGLVVVGGGRPYPAGEVSRSLAVQLVADVPWDPVTAAVLSEGELPPRKLTARPLWRGFQSLASQLQALEVAA